MDFYTFFTEPLDNLSEEKMSDVLNQFGLALDNLVKEFLQLGPSSPLRDDYMVDRRDLCRRIRNHV